MRPSAPGWLTHEFVDDPRNSNYDWAPDRELLQGWQDVAFINPANLVFVYMLVRDLDTYDETMEGHALSPAKVYILMVSLSSHYVLVFIWKLRVRTDHQFRFALKLVKN